MRPSPLEADLLELTSHAADQAVAYPYKVWGYGEGPALRGALTAATALNRPDLVDAVAAIVAPSLNARRDEEIDHLIAVDVLLELHRLRPDIAVGASVERFVAAVEGAARPVPGQPQVHRPHHPTLGRTVWVDCLHTDGPGLVAAGRPEAAVRVVGEAAAVLQDETGLFSHGYRVDLGRANGVHWARGQGWALYGLVGVLGAVRDRALLRVLHRLVAALAAHESDGRWPTVVDDPDSPPEASLSPMVAATVATAIDADLLDPSWWPLVDRALGATLAAVIPAGSLPVSEATPVGAPAIYHQRPDGVFPWGQGPLLDALRVARTRQEAVR